MAAMAKMISTVLYFSKKPGSGFAGSLVGSVGAVFSFAGSATGCAAFSPAIKL